MTRAALFLLGIALGVLLGAVCVVIGFQLGSATAAVPSRPVPVVFSPLPRFVTPSCLKQPLRELIEESDDSAETEDYQKIRTLAMSLPTLPRPEADRLELIFGNMHSGKTSELMRRMKIRSIYKKICTVNTKKDTRYGNDGIITHDKITMKSVRVDNLNELLSMKEYVDAEVIGIDEGNFFTEIFDFIMGQLEMTSKTFIIAGLSGDKDKKFFGTMHQLIPHAEKPEFLRAVCKRCANGTEASFTIDIVKFEGQEKVGDLRRGHRMGQMIPSRYGVVEC